MAGDRTLDEDWHFFPRWFGGASVALFALLLAFILAIDPYDTGRTGLISRHGLPDQFPTTANASRARDPNFNAAIFGNSRVQQLSPPRLDRATGLSFVSLSIPGSGPADQLSVLRWFMDQHGHAPRAIVLGMDAPWCLPEARLSARFPAWLYTPDLLDYITGLIRWRSVEGAFRRITFLRTGKGGARRDGYWDYVPFFERAGLADEEASRRKIEAISFSTFGANPSGDYPALGSLSKILDRTSANTHVVLLRPPVHARGLPRPGSPEEANARACAARINQMANQRPRTTVIDLLGPGGFSAEFGNFYDYDHYRDTTAVAIEQLIVKALAGSA